MAWIELVSVPSQKSSVSVGTGVSLCHFLCLVLCVVCLLLHLFVFEKCFPAFGCGESWISADYRALWDREYCKNNVSLAFFPNNKQKV